MLPTEWTLDRKSIELVVDPPVPNTFAMIFRRASLAGLWSGPRFELNVTDTTSGFLFRLTLLLLVVNYW